MTRTVAPELWRVMTVQGPSDPVHRESFADPSKAIAIGEYESCCRQWPKDGAVYLLDTNGVRQRAHDPSGQWIPAPHKEDRT